VFPAAEVEQRPIAQEIVERVREVDPDRAVVDPLTQLTSLTSDDYQFRKQVIGFMRFLTTAGEEAVLPASARRRSGPSS
jgi:circadian clock protein KaiC